MILVNTIQWNIEIHFHLCSLSPPPTKEHALTSISTGASDANVCTLYGCCWYFFKCLEGIPSNEDNNTFGRPQCLRYLYTHTCIEHLSQWFVTVEFFWRHWYRNEQPCFACPNRKTNIYQNVVSFKYIKIFIKLKECFHITMHGSHIWGWVD